MALPKDISIPRSTGQFMKLIEGKNKFRVLSDVSVGWEGWKDNKPFRHEGNVCKIKPEQVDLNQNGLPNINYFWAMVVWNYTEEKTQVLTITQKTIMNVLKSLEENTDWGDIKNYDLVIERTKVGDKTTYTTVAIPPKSLTPEIKDAYEKTDVDLKKLFAGEYPINEVKYPTEDVNPDSIPF